VSVSFVVRLMKSFRATGALAPKPSGGRRHAKLDPHRAFLLGRVAEKADITMPELSAELATASGTKADPASLSRWLIRNGYRFKKTLLASEQDRPDVKGAREEWTTTRQLRMRLEPHRLARSLAKRPVRLPAPLASRSRLPACRYQTEERRLVRRATATVKAPVGRLGWRIPCR
jgi:transposase